jgi:hypothetical protein
MASNQSWDEERTQTRTRKVHQLEEVSMLTTKIDLLINKLEILGGTSPVSRSTTTNKVVWGKTSTEVNHLSRILFRII